MIRTAPDRVRAMNALAPSKPPAFARAVQRQARAGAAGDADAARGAAKSCARCAIGACATQLVWGEGPSDAPVMIVGEQPGDHEDLAGRPFVGPAGRILDQALAAAGVDRTQLYVTNAVKHFKFQPRGKRRLHQRPNAGEVQACQWWLDLEIKRIRPRMIVALGATAARALTGSRDRMTKRRGTVEPSPMGIPVCLTFHPAFLLRLPGAEQSERQKQIFRTDIANALALVQMEENAPGASCLMPQV